MYSKHAHKQKKYTIIKTRSSLYHQIIFNTIYRYTNKFAKKQIVYDINKTDDYIIDIDNYCINDVSN